MKVLFLSLLAIILSASEMKYDCGVVGEFPKSIPEQNLLFTIYVDSTNTMTVLDGYNRKMSVSKYSQTVHAYEITEDFVDLSKQIPKITFENFKKNIKSDNLLFDKFIDINTGNFWLFEKYKINGYNNVAFILKSKNFTQGKQFIQLMCGPR